MAGGGVASRSTSVDSAAAARATGGHMTRTVGDCMHYYYTKFKRRRNETTAGAGVGAEYHPHIVTSSDYLSLKVLVCFCYFTTVT